MNNKLSIAYLILVISPLVFGCGGSVTGNNKNIASPGPLSMHVGDEKYFMIDTKESVVKWKGSNSFGSHAGYVSISKGELMIEKEQLLGGAMEINMNTIVDEAHQGTSGLIKHLKDHDFFDVNKFPMSAISITKVETISSEEIKVTADLTIKGITNPVSFPAKLEVKDKIVKANSSFVIDRTKWDVRYNSGKFYDNLADKTISDSIEFNISIVAKK